MACSPTEQEERNRPIGGWWWLWCSMACSYKVSNQVKNTQNYRITKFSDDLDSLTAPRPRIKVETCLHAIHMLDLASSRVV